jgi:hypothetical protein
MNYFDFYWQYLIDFCILWEWPYKRGLHFVGVALQERTTVHVYT